ncbi:MAG TPA: hemolysin III [Herpetosiphon sp.]|uniref:Channel protein, hemolysin III family n=1 Tax=Herpetosiphon aurantiacus (strain ATCC 23779 / DSM 785 / 114-95) TaxID=316274 RepID=A9AXP1_HERA2|nr:hemolysin III family protein [Herpetosiphon sp.]ABX03455.1 channel protein, hemolysin III family [Herpetosiphon aurantiacus DSM 785]HBW52942.1 hemolysin III [Herpetosiphon sp.]
MAKAIEERNVHYSEYSAAEELANAITHGIGVALSVAGLAILLIMAINTGDPWRIASFTVYGVSLICMYLASTLYHSIRNPRAKYLLKIFDHCAIYLLIAGTYTPILLVSMQSSLAWTLFGLIWGCAFAGICFKMFFIKRFELLSTLMYVGMGWLSVMAWDDLVASLPTGAFALLVAGGLTYTAGVVFYRWEKLPYNHAIWHGFVMGGSVCHFLVMALYLG